MQKYLFISLCTLLLSGCASQPKQVIASRPLVENVLPSDFQVIPQKYWSVLASKEEKEIEHNNATVRLGRSFISGLGNSCRLLHIKEVATKTEQNRVACYDKEQASWYLTPAIIDKDETEVFSQ